MTKFESLVETARQLRAPGGCPWDAEQTHESLVQYLLEETYELIEAIEAGDRDEGLKYLAMFCIRLFSTVTLQAKGALVRRFHWRMLPSTWNKRCAPDTPMFLALRKS